MPKTIYVTTESSGYKEECYWLSETTIVNAHEYQQDAQLALWYWCLDQIDQGFNVDFCCDDFMWVASEGYDWSAEYLGRQIEEITLS